MQTRGVSPFLYIFKAAGVTDPTDTMADNRRRGPNVRDTGDQGSITRVGRRSELQYTAASCGKSEFAREGNALARRVDLARIPDPAQDRS